jgi:hypothetical protein
MEHARPVFGRIATPLHVRAPIRDAQNFFTARTPPIPADTPVQKTAKSRRQILRVSSLAFSVASGGCSWRNMLTTPLLVRRGGRFVRCTWTPFLSTWIGAPRGWERNGEPRDFSLEFYFGDEVFYPDELNAFTTIEPGFAKVWVVFGWVGSHPDVYPDPLTFLDPRFITNVVVYFRHRGHGCRLSHLGGLSIPDP